MSEPATGVRSTVVFEAPCPRCLEVVTWYAHPSEPCATPACTRPTCRVEELVEK